MNKQRHQRYFQLSSAIAQLDNAQLRARFDPEVRQNEWGVNHVIEIEQTAVFVKRIPMTTLEHANMFSTKNLYELPLFFQYRFGSLGFGVFRELISHIKTTNWVLADKIDTFPLLYHYRIMPATDNRVSLDMAYHKRFVEYWGSNKNISHYRLERASAPYELVLFIEHFPHTISNWLIDNQDKLGDVLADAKAAIEFLRSHDIIHLDAHFSNLLTDGERTYLTDFGLAMDKQFALSDRELQFYEQHTQYDDGNLLWSLGSYLFWMLRNLPDAEQQQLYAICQVENGLGFEEMLPILLDQMNVLAEKGLLNLEPDFAASIINYRPVTAFMHDFYVTMRVNNQKDTPFQDDVLRQLLVQSGF